MRSSRVWPGIGRARPTSKTAAITVPLGLICPLCMWSVLQVYGLVVAVEFHRGRSLFLRSEAGVLGSAERQLVFDARTGKIDGQQPRFSSIDVLEGAGEIGGLNAR